MYLLFHVYASMDVSMNAYAMMMMDTRVLEMYSFFSSFLYALTL